MSRWGKARHGESLMQQREGWTTGGNVSFAVPIAQPADREIPESDVLAAALELLKTHPKVAWAKRMNVGKAKLNGHWVSFGWLGASDVIGQMRDGRFLAVECKRAGEDLSPEQREFLTTVARNGGVAIVVRELDDLVRVLGGPLKLL